MYVVAEITSRWDINGVLCLTSIPCLIIAILAYSKGFMAGSSTCLILFVICALCTGDNSTSYSTTPGFITNKSQTKWIRQNEHSINDSDCMFFYTGTSTTTSLDDKALFIPAEEIMVVNGIKCMKPDGREINNDDFYMYDEVVNHMNAPSSAGGWGMLTWVYHPAAPTWIFGIGGLPALLGGMFIASKLRD
jgi:hypothetical protein